jgi:pimeloyl-ACP methyl ester carboxylesterase
MVDTSYGQTFIRISGPRHGQPLVLLHGLAATSLMWIPNIVGWSERYRTYALDTIGDPGRSVALKRMKSPADYMRWLDEVLDALQLHSGVHLLGVSYGGWLTGQYALHAPKRLARVVLMAPAGTILPLSFSFVARFMLMRTGSSSLLRSNFRWLFADWRRINPLALDEFIAAKELEGDMTQLAIVRPTLLTGGTVEEIGKSRALLVGESRKIYSGSREPSSSSRPQRQSHRHLRCGSRPGRA